MSSTHKHKSHSKSKHHSKTKKPVDPIISPVEPVYSGFVPGACILSNSADLKLDKSNNYCITFDIGDVSGSHIDVSSTGNSIDISTPGTYYISLIGEATAYTEVSAHLHYNVTKNTMNFDRVLLKTDANKILLTGTETLLILNSPGSISVCIVPQVDETIILHSGTKLILYRVC